LSVSPDMVVFRIVVFFPYWYKRYNLRDILASGSFEVALKITPIFRTGMSACREKST